MYEVIIGRSPQDVKKYGLTGTIFLGKHYVKMGRTTSLSNEVFLDVSGAHVYFICGKRGGGKCLHGDTLITLNDGTQKPIKELEGDSKGIFSLNNQLKIQETSKSHFYKREVNNLLELKLKSGKEIKLTPEHPLFTVKGWIPAEKLKVGSRIATPRKIDAFGDDFLKESETKILAYLLAEGHLSNNFVLFSNADKKIVEDFKNSIYDFDKNLKVKAHSSELCFRVVENKKRVILKQAKRDDKGRFNSKPVVDSKSSIRKWLDSLGIYGKLAHQKIIPQIVFRLPKNKTAIFLNRLFSCDGTIYKEGRNYWKIAYSSSSKEMIHQVQHLLLRFGIISTIRNKKTKKLPSYEIIIRGEHVSAFIHEICFFGVKELKANKALKETVRIIRNPNTDTIPKDIWEIYSPKNWASLGRKIDYSIPKSLRESQRYSVSRQKLLQIALADNAELIEKFATSDIFWDEIISIKPLEGKFEVYDLTVPIHHNFVANDIIVHNSYTMGVISEGMAGLPKDIRNNLSFLLFDTMGIYWTMKYPNKQDKEMLADWGLSPKALDVIIYTPKGYFKEFKEKGIPTDHPFSINPFELDARDWCQTFVIDPSTNLGVMIESVIHKMKEEIDNYSVDDIISYIKKDESSSKDVKDAAINRFINAKNWGIFDTDATKLSDIIAGGQVTVLDVSCYATMPGGWEIKNLVIGLVSQKLFTQRMVSRRDEEFKDVHTQMNYFYDEDKPQTLEDPLVWLVIDEAHEFLPREGKTLATDSLVTIMREGRQPGISLILATQQPGKIHTDVMTQSDVVISHRITAKIDTDALSALTQSYMREGLDKYLNELPAAKGSAIVLDDNNEKIFPIKIRPRFTWHGGGSPFAIKEGKKIFEM
jgi:uncharacterized protein